MKNYENQIVSKKIHLSDIVSSFAERGKTTFQRKEIEDQFVSEKALTEALVKLLKKKVIVSPYKKFYIIVPVQYRSLGAPPALWFIHDWMTVSASSYYIGLLSAASIYGAAHHAVQETEVIVQKQYKQKVVGSSRIRFFYNKNVLLTPKQKWKVPTGYIWVSTPAATAIELVSYMEQIGGPSLVATVLSELCEQIKAGEIREAATVMKTKTPILQRLGLIFDLLNQLEFANEINSSIIKKKPRIILLNTARKVSQKSSLNQKWKVYMNDTVEPDV